jgi:hypothetical protein
MTSPPPANSAGALGAQLARRVAKYNRDNDDKLYNEAMRTIEAGALRHSENGLSAFLWHDLSLYAHEGPSEAVRLRITDRCRELGLWTQWAPRRGSRLYEVRVSWGEEPVAAGCGGCTVM